MAQEKLLTIREVSILLGTTEKEVIDLAESGQLPAYKVGGVYLRFKGEQVEDFIKRSSKFSKNRNAQTLQPFKEKLIDFLYFNDFYIAAGIIIFAMLAVIFRNYQ